MACFTILTISGELKFLPMHKGRFWDYKILGWEASRYGGTGEHTPPPQNSVSSRMQIVAGFLSRPGRGQHLLDLGCGSGRLFQMIPDGIWKTRHGIDLSETAITHGKDFFKGDPSTTLSSGNVCDMEWPRCDFVCGLGLLDWLNDTELEQLVHRLGNRSFLFSYSERRPSALRFLHMAYVFLAYGWRTKGYAPRYYTEKKVRHIFSPNGERPIYFFRDPALSFGTLVSDQPFA